MSQGYLVPWVTGTSLCNETCTQSHNQCQLHGAAFEAEARVEAQ